MNFIISAWCLSRKLVARNIDDLEAFVMECLVHFFELLILRSKAASSSGVDDYHNFAFKLFQADFFSFRSWKCVVINAAHIFSPFYFVYK